MGSTPPPPPAPLPPPPKDIVSEGAAINRQKQRQRSLLAGGLGQNRTLIATTIDATGGDTPLGAG